MSEPILIHSYSKMGDAERAELLKRTEDDLTPFMQQVAPVIDAVRDEGDEALRRLPDSLTGQIYQTHLYVPAPLILMQRLICLPLS